jgi:hypothetical protein
MYRVGVLTCLVAIAGCGLDAVEIETSMTEQAVQDICDSDGVCPTNSPVVKTFPFIDLYVLPNQQANAQGFVISRFEINGVSHGFRVQNGRISGQLGNTIVTGNGLNGAELYLRRAGTEYVLRIKSVVPIRMWAKLTPASLPLQVEAYELEWAHVLGGNPISQWLNVCRAAMLKYGSPDLVYGSSLVQNYVTFVIEGERIDPKAKAITGWNTNWINLGCAGHTLMKMYLTGHVGIAASMGYFTTMDERQTMMKMFAADYCGRGHPFTVPGVPLQWQDHRGWLSYTGTVATIEARWTPNGAACLNVPRVMAHPTSDSRAQWPFTVIPEINAHCPALLSTSCAASPQDFFGYHLVTANR